MARRMFSDKIVDTDAFLDMGQGSQLLYFHLAMRADDDGFVANPKKVMRMIGSQEDDYRVLMAKKFILQFESGVCVIKHWLIHNLIRNDRYTPTQWVTEMNQLMVDPETKKYSLNKGDNPVIPTGNQLATQYRVGKERLGKDKEVELPEWVNKEVWKDWEGYRKDRKQKLTPRSVTLQLKFLEKDITNHVAIIEQSIQNGWTGLFPLKVDNVDKPVRVLNFNKK